MTASRPAFRRIAGIVLASVLTALAVGQLTTRDAAAAPIVSINPNALSNNVDGFSRIIIETTNSYIPTRTTVTFTRVDQASGQTTGDSFTGVVRNAVATSPTCPPAPAPCSAPDPEPTNRFEVDVNPFGRNPGSYNVRVSGDTRSGAGLIVPVEPDTCSRCFFILTPGSPTITSINTPRLSAGTTVGTVVIQGSNFGANGTTVQFLRNGEVDPTVTFSRTGGTTTRIEGTVRTESNALPGPRDVRVTNSDLQSGTCVNCVAVSGILVSRLDPSAATNAEVRRVIIFGSGFPAGAQAEMIREVQTGQPTIGGGNPVVFSSGEMHADFDFRGAEAGRYLVRVFSSDGQANNIACSPKFVVANAASPNPTLPPTASPSPAAPGTCVDNNQPFPTPSGSAVSPSPSLSPTPSSTATPTGSPTGTPSATASASPTPPAGAGRFVAVNPERVLDTREGLNSNSLPVGPGETRNFTVTGRAGVPTGATAVAMNVTAIQPTRAGFLTVFPAGGSRPLASNLNFVAGDVIANLVIVRIGSAGQVSIFNNSGNTHVAADVVGYYGPATGGSAYTAVNPDRILDTRDGNGGSTEPIGSGESRSLQVTGRGGVPATATAVAINLTAISPSASGFLTAYPSGTTRPVASNINFVRGDTIANLVIVRLGADGKINIFNNSGFTQAAADVVGYFSDTGGSQALYTSLNPERIMDTRNGTGGPSSPIGPGESRELQVTGRASVPANATAVAFNLTAIEPSSSGFFTAFPTGTLRPTASNINFVRGDVIPNLVIVRVGAGGKVSIYNNSGFANAAADIVGYFVGTAPSATPSATSTSTSTATPTASTTATPTATPTASTTATTTPSASVSATTSPSVSTSAVAFSGPAGDTDSTSAGLLVLALFVVTGGAGFLLTPRYVGSGHYRRRH
ncbi:MAG TPA: hypothetical protein VNA14_07580 [Mycobacteriales bacterium]|nr:hypothetical protein [Mycobacteriales bacterium]